MHHNMKEVYELHYEKGEPLCKMYVTQYYNYYSYSFISDPKLSYAIKHATGNQ